MGPIVGIGFGPSASVAYVVTLGFGISSVYVPAAGPMVAVAGQVWAPGAEAGEVHYGS